MSQSVAKETTRPNLVKKKPITAYHVKTDKNFVSLLSYLLILNFDKLTEL